MTVVVSCVALAENKLDAVTLASILEVDPDVVDLVLRAGQEMGIIAAVKKAEVKKASEEKAHRLPDGWKLPQEGVEYARKHGFYDRKISDMVEDFSNHHRSRGNRMVNWNLAWQTWVRNQVKFAGKRGPIDAGLFSAPPPPPPDNRSGTYRIAVEAWAKSRTWNHALGPEPGEPGCRVPAEILREFRVA